MHAHAIKHHRWVDEGNFYFLQWSRDQSSTDTQVITNNNKIKIQGSHDHETHKHNTQNLKEYAKGGLLI